MLRTQGRVAAALVGMSVALAAACAPSSPRASLPPPAASPTPAAVTRADLAPEPAPPPVAQSVHLGVLHAASDAGFFIAQDLGYFREQGLELDMTPFDSAARMVAPLGAGQLEIGGGAHSAGLFNAVARGVDLRLVADKGSSPSGYGFQGLAFRRDLTESGQLRTPADLRGRRVALPARGITTEVALAGWLRQGGLSLSDVEVAELGFPDHITALASGAIDASVTIEPFLTRILGEQLGTLYQRTDELL